MSELPHITPDRARELARELKGADPVEVAWRGIEHCRQNDWQEGLYWLSLAAAVKAKKELPSLFYAYLGYGVARYQSQTRQGLKLCRRAVDMEFYQPENYFFLARTYLLLGDRRGAFDTIERGLQIDPGHEGLVGLRGEFGARRAPFIPFLSRKHFLNRILGKVRHGLLQGRKAPRRSGG